MNRNRPYGPPVLPIVGAIDRARSGAPASGGVNSDIHGEVL